MSRSSRRRRLARRERAQTSKPHEAPSRPVDEARLVARFAHLVHRGFRFGFQTVGPVVDVTTPALLVEHVEEWAVAEAGKQRPS
jgi:hypothetical protein